MSSHLLDNFINELKTLPGISKATAQKVAYYLSGKDNEIKNLSEALELLKNMKVCKECFNVSEHEVCDICTDKTREKILVIVEKAIDIDKFEKAGTLNCYYHVLGDLLRINKKNDNLDKLNVQTLDERAKKYSEVIIALSPNLEGIVTANLIKNIVHHDKITQLAQGVPLGAAMEYVDEMTLKSAITNRKVGK